MKRNTLTAAEKAACRNIAQRQVDAIQNFGRVVVERTGCTQEIGERVAGYYLKVKVAKMDSVMGVINVKHGAFLDLDVLQNAIAEVTK